MDQIPTERHAIWALCAAFIALITALTYGCTYSSPSDGLEAREAQMIEGKLKLACIQKGGSVQRVQGEWACLDRRIVYVDKAAAADEVFFTPGTTAQTIPPREAH
jgi:hypothetical protein